MNRNNFAWSAPMMIMVAIVLICPLASIHAQQTWKPVPAPLSTRWAAEVSPQNVLPEYPRPQMRRSQWQNLNGLWQYAITSLDSAKPAAFDSSILVPFPIESSLSGVRRPLKPDQRLWYRRLFTLTRQKGRQKWLLHFGAVDWEAKVYLNGHLLGTHRGGYCAFSFDMTRYLNTGDNELIVAVWDPTDKSKNAFGKQSLSPHSTWYTATSGIWQTVWIEPVNPLSIASIRLTPDLDKGRLRVEAQLAGDGKDVTIEAIAMEQGRTVASMQRTLHHDAGRAESMEGRATKARGASDLTAGDHTKTAAASSATKGAVSESTAASAAESTLELDIPHPHRWSPKDPFLYDLVVRLVSKGKAVDSVESYFGMRKIAVKKDEKGIDRIFLNDQYVFQLGTLDQGFWPEGCYTAPTDSALSYDIIAEKEMGFNTIRKHLKVEPARWYYHCDRLGMLVWQDVPARYPRIDSSTDTREARSQFEWEMQEEFRQLQNAPSIVMWILFNEDWAIYDKDRLETWARKEDPSRLLNTNTGSKKSPGLSGDLSVVHHYCYPLMPPHIPGKACVLGEFGGITDVVEKHDWDPNRQWGHGEVMPGIDFANIYEDMMRRVKEMEAEGLSGSIFTQPYDVEQEKCGLMTYDRAIFKIPMDSIQKVNRTLVP